MRIDVGPVREGEKCAICDPVIRGEIPEESEDDIQTTGLVVVWSDGSSEPVCANCVSRYGEDIPLIFGVQVGFLEREVTSEDSTVADEIGAHVARLQSEIALGCDITQDAADWAAGYPRIAGEEEWLKT